MTRRIFGILIAATMAAPAVVVVGQTRQRPAAVTLSSLTARQRDALPDDAAVTIGGKVYNVGVLRRNHQRIAGGADRVSAFVSSATRNLTAPASARPMAPARLPTSASATAAKLAPLPVIEPKTAYAANAKEMQVFCDQAKAAACLYLPGGLTLDVLNNYVGAWQGELWQVDPWVTDSAECQALGGVYGVVGAGGTTWGTYPACHFNYMLAYTAQFKVDPSRVLTTQTSCNTKYFRVKLIDPSGIIFIEPAITTASSWAPWVTADPVWCIVKATLEPKG